MTTPTTDFGNDVKKALEQLATLRDEIKVKLHLAGMDVKESWSRIEPKLAEAEKQAGEATEASRAVLTELVAEAKRIHSALVS